MTPEQIQAVTAWCGMTEAGSPQCFRKRMTLLTRSLGIPATRLNALLKRCVPELWGRVNRLRETWYTYRDAAVKNASHTVTRADLEAKLDISRYTRRIITKRVKVRSPKPPRRWVLTDRVADQLDMFEEAIEVFEAERELPFRTVAAVEAFARAVDLSVADARHCVLYLRPDLWTRYRKQRKRYLDAFERECQSDDPVAQIADRFDVAEASVRSKRWRLRNPVEKKT